MGIRPADAFRQFGLAATSGWANSDQPIQLTRSSITGAKSAWVRERWDWPAKLLRVVRVAVACKKRGERGYDLAQQPLGYSLRPAHSLSTHGHQIPGAHHLDVVTNVFPQSAHTT